MINIKLAKHEANFVPAERIAGKVTWSEAVGDSLEVRLIWYTAGKGERDFGVVATHRVSDFGSSGGCLLYTSPSPRDRQKSRMPSSA